MIEKVEESKRRDYSCEIISLVVLVILSGLSHFWYILIAAGIAGLFWGAIVLLGQLATIAARKFFRAPRAVQTMERNSIVPGTQVFQPSEIRQSVDC